jgi:hypothetical protein
MTPRGTARLLLLVALASLLTGCDLLYYSLYPPTDPWDPTETPITSSYEEGAASLDFDEGTLVVALDGLAPGSRYDSLMGASVGWKDDAGWSLTVMAYDPSTFGGFPGPGGTVTIGRVEGHEYWVAGGYYDESRCIVTVDEITESLVRGTARCDRLRWTDGTTQSVSLMAPVYVEGQEPFDVHITFEAEVRDPAPQS